VNSVGNPSLGWPTKLRQSIRETLSSIRNILADIQLRNNQKVVSIDAVMNTEITTASVETQIDKFKKNVTEL